MKKLIPVFAIVLLCASCRSSAKDYYECQVLTAKTQENPLFAEGRPTIADCMAARGWYEDVWVENGKVNEMWKR